MIGVNSFISDTLNTVDAVIGNFVVNAYNNLIQANTEVITLLFTLYVMFLGYRFLTHEESSLMQIMKHLILLLCVYSMIMSWNLYNIFVYNIFINEPNAIAKILVTSTGQPGATVVQTLDAIYESVLTATLNLFGQVGFSSSGLAFIFYGGIVFIIGSLLCIFSLLLFIYAKMMTAVALALGPIFILFLLFDATKDMFGAWLRKLITLVLIPIVTSAILALMLSVIKVTLPQLNQPAESMQFYGIAPFLGLALATVLILSQVYGICSSLGGGISIAGLSKGAGIAKSALDASGITTASKKALNWTMNKTVRGKNNLFRNQS